MISAYITSSGVRRAAIGTAVEPRGVTVTSTGGGDPSTRRIRSSAVTARTIRSAARACPPTKSSSGGRAPARTRSSKSADSTSPASRSWEARRLRSSASSSRRESSMPPAPASAAVIPEAPRSTMPSRGCGSNSDPNTTWISAVSTNGTSSPYRTIGERGPSRRSLPRIDSTRAKFIAAPSCRSCGVPMISCGAYPPPQDQPAGREEGGRPGQRQAQMAGGIGPAGAVRGHVDQRLHQRPGRQHANPR